MTSVINIKVQYIRPVYQNLQEWVQDEKNVYIGRKGIVFINGERYPKHDSIFANPFKIYEGTSRDEVIEKYSSYILEKIINEEGFLEKLYGLKGKNLGCWCKPEKCHGDVLKKIIDLL